MFERRRPAPLKQKEIGFLAWRRSINRSSLRDLSTTNGRRFQSVLLTQRSGRCAYWQGSQTCATKNWDAPLQGHWKFQLGQGASWHFSADGDRLWIP